MKKTKRTTKKNRRHKILFLFAGRRQMCKLKLTNSIRLRVRSLFSQYNGISVILSNIFAHEFLLQSNMTIRYTYRRKQPNERHQFERLPTLPSHILGLVAYK